MLPDGVLLRPLAPNVDPRGSLTEFYRDSWGFEAPLAQWNLVKSNANVLRGVHVHLDHWDYLVVAAGRVTTGLYDVRPGSHTEGLAATLQTTGDDPAVVMVPPGVTHGFYYEEPSIQAYAMSHEWDPARDFGCRWDDPALGIEWPCTDPLLSPKDDALGSLSELQAAWRAALVTART